MKKHFLGLLLTVAFCLPPTITRAQMPGGGMGGPRGPKIDAAMAKLFGDHQTFTAGMESRIKHSDQQEPMSMTGKLAFDSGKARIEVNMSDARGGGMPPQMREQLKSMGMDQMIVITQPDQKSLMMYPGLKAYAEMPKDRNSDGAGDKLDLETTELGKETVDGHPCVKSKAVVTNAKGDKQEFTLWKATDLKDFPVKIETTEREVHVTTLFKDVKFEKPAAGLFEAPEGFKQYGSVMELMQQEMMKRMGGPGGPGMMPRQP